MDNSIEFVFHAHFYWQHADDTVYYLTEACDQYGTPEDFD